MAKAKNREHWLRDGAMALIPRLEDITDQKMPDFHISVGFPSRRALSEKKRVIGQCWDGLVSEDKKPQLFISPVISEPVEVLATVAHELIHGIGNKGHRGRFPHIALAMGLAGHPTQTYAGEEFINFVTPLLDKLGPYPHARLVANGTHKAAPTALKKAFCPECGYIVRVTRVWVEMVGAPICPHNMQPMTVEL